MREVTKIRLNTFGRLGAWLFIAGPLVTAMSIYWLTGAVAATRFTPLTVYNLLPHIAGITIGTIAFLGGAILLLVGREYYRE